MTDKKPPADHSAKDTDTASIYSTAPSYISEARYHHSEDHHGEPPPSYTDTLSKPLNQARNYAAERAHTTATASPSPGQDIPGLPPSHRNRPPIEPNLDNFRCISIPTPTASRHLHSAPDYRMRENASLTRTHVDQQTGHQDEVHRTAIVAYARPYEEERYGFGLLPSRRRIRRRGFRRIFR